MAKAKTTPKGKKVEALKTSKEWQNELSHRIQIIDADGWDRQNFEYSWGEEKISIGEFKERCQTSTLNILDKTFFK
jgi:hypothetical protein